jgi:simple sugar transport system ATP-binding protein
MSEAVLHTDDAVAHGAALGLRGVVKRFGDLVALDGVDFEVREGEVHALLGENGAGKTTLMNVAAGVLAADAGAIFVNGSETSFRSPRDALAQGIGIVHQQFRLVSAFTVAENVHLGWDKTPRLISDDELAARTVELGERFAVAVEPTARIFQLSIGQRQKVAILRVLSRGARTVILDEPTAVLTPLEVSGLFTTIRTMVADGHSVVFISHKLDEVLAVADRITVLRGGRHVATLEAAACTPAMLAKLMVGHELGRGTGVVREAAGDELLAGRGLCAVDDRGLPALRDVSISVRAGEVVGVAGVSGNGQRELAEVLTGLRKATSGSVHVEGRDLTGAGPDRFIAAGVGHIPEDLTTGIAVGESVRTNAIMKRLDRPPVRFGPFVRHGRIRQVAMQLVESAKIGKINTSRSAGTLSGGQTQRLLVHRELGTAEKVLVAAYPARGLDVLATEHVHQLLLAARTSGCGVLLISEDLDEILKLSDRTVVLYEGRTVGEFARGRAGPERIGVLMGGGKVDEEGFGDSESASQV